MARATFRLRRADTRIWLRHADQAGSRASPGLAGPGRRPKAARKDEVLAMSGADRAARESDYDGRRPPAERPPHAKLGAKRQCQACGAKFYDLGKRPVVCSRCGAEVDLAAARPSEGARRRPAADEPARARAPAAPPPAGAARAAPKWSAEQAAALDKVGRWLKAGEPQVFRLFGYAGVGKTTLARHVADGARRAKRPSPPSPARRRWCCAPRAAPAPQPSTR